MTKAKPIPTARTGELPNKDGAYLVEPDETSYWGKNAEWAEAKLLKLTNGNYLHGFDYSFRDGGQRGPIFAHGDGETREEAIKGLWKSVQDFMEMAKAKKRGKAVLDSIMRWGDSLDEADAWVSQGSEDRDQVSETPPASRAQNAAETIRHEKPVIGEVATSGVFEAARENSIREQQEVHAALFDLGCNVGISRMADAQRTFAQAAQIRAFALIKESNAFKHLRLKFSDGLRPAQNIDEFCRVVFGRGYRVMQENERSLERLGEESFEAVTHIGVGRAEMRLLVSMPEDEREMLQEAVKANDKGEVASVIHDLVDKLQKERGKVEDLKARAASKDVVISGKEKTISELQEQLVTREKEPETEDEAGDPSAEVVQAVETAVRQARYAVMEFRATFNALKATGMLEVEQREIRRSALGRVMASLRARAGEWDVPLSGPEAIDEDSQDDAFWQQMYAEGRDGSPSNPHPRPSPASGRGEPIALSPSGGELAPTGDDDDDSATLDA
ncbi:hypothetical protein AGMMS50256_25770 [Betaproteobacteria bacterium]|nr:hypothetical protein AGMMS50256_25770 [Betaproteobacteria bacterium]